MLVAQSRLTLCHSTDCSLPGFSVHGILLEYWSGLPFPSPEKLPTPGIEPWSPASQADSLPFELQRSLVWLTFMLKFSRLLTFKFNFAGVGFLISLTVCNKTRVI